MRDGKVRLESAQEARAGPCMLSSGKDGNFSGCSSYHYKMTHTEKGDLGSERIPLGLITRLTRPFWQPGYKEKAEQDMVGASSIAHG